MPETWEAILTPFLQGRGGSVETSIDDELQWTDDPLALDPFEDVFDTEARNQLDPEVQAAARQTLSLDAPDILELEAGGLERTPDAMSGQPRAPRFRLPTALTKGERTADFIAASKGVDVRAPKGTGKLLDIAKTQLGVDYLFGSFQPGQHFDCSGFTKWVYSRALGVALPHSARDQDAGLKDVGRDDLQPGDLVFYVYGRLGNDVDHVGIYIGNGKQIAASSSADQVAIQDVDWDNFVRGGRPDSVADVGGGGGEKPPNWDKLTGKEEVTQPVTKRVPVKHDVALAPMALADGAPAFASVMDAMFAPDKVPMVVEKNMRGSKGGTTNQQLKRGFIDAGRPDLARMVGTKDFRTWLNAESGYDPSRVSQPYSGVRNYGIFQFRALDGREWLERYISDNGMGFAASAYDQAKLVAKFFGHLTAERIREYAAQVRAGTYGGWG